MREDGSSDNASAFKELSQWKKNAAVLEKLVAARDAEVAALTEKMREVMTNAGARGADDSAAVAAVAGKEVAQYKANAAQLEALVATRDKQAAVLAEKLRATEKKLQQASSNGCGTDAGNGNNAATTQRLQAVLDETIAENNELIEALKASNEHAAEMASHEHELEEELQESDEHLKEATALNKSLFEQIQQLKSQLAAANS